MLKVTCAIIVCRGKILVTQRGANTDHPFQWEFPGGKLKSDEFPEDCIVREIREELEINIKVFKKMHPVIWDYGFKKIELIPFLCLIDSGEINLTEHIQFFWKDLESLSELYLSDADNKLIKLPENQSILKEYFRENMNDPCKYDRPSNE